MLSTRIPKRVGRASLEQLQSTTDALVTVTNRHIGERVHNREVTDEPPISIVRHRTLSLGKYRVGRSRSWKAFGVHNKLSIIMTRRKG